MQNPSIVLLSNEGARALADMQTLISLNIGDNSIDVAEATALAATQTLISLNIEEDPKNHARKKLADKQAIDALIFFLLGKNQLDNPLSTLPALVFQTIAGFALRGLRSPSFIDHTVTLLYNNLVTHRRSKSALIDWKINTPDGKPIFSPWKATTLSLFSRYAREIEMEKQNNQETNTNHNTLQK